MKSPQQLKGGGAGGGPAATALSPSPGAVPSGARGASRRCAGGAAAGGSGGTQEAVEVCGVVVTAAAVRALNGQAHVPGFTRVVAVLLRLLRKQRGLSQGKLARLAGVSRQAVGQLEQAHYGALYFVMWRLCRALGIGLGEVSDAAEAVLAREWQV